MKTTVTTLISFVFSFTLIAADHVAAKPYNKPLDDKKDQIKWLDFESAIDKNNNIDRKYIFIDVYTGWCGWCKKMDQTTFKHSAVVDYLNEYYYAVKMDAESKEAIAYNEVLYEYKMYSGKGYNELAVQLLNSKMSFPTFVVLSKRERKLGLIRGFKKADDLIKALSDITGKDPD